MIAFRCGGLVLVARIEHGAHALLPALDNAALLIEVDHDALAGDLVAALLQMSLLRQGHGASRVVEHGTPAGRAAIALVDADLAFRHHLARFFGAVGIEHDAQRLAVHRHVGLRHDDLAPIGEHPRLVVELHRVRGDMHRPVVATQPEAAEQPLELIAVARVATVVGSGPVGTTGGQRHHEHHEHDRTPQHGYLTSAATASSAPSTT